MNTNFFIALYQQFYSQIYNYIFYRVLNKEITEDLVSEVFLKIISKYNEYDHYKGKLSTWIFSITKNTLIDYYRKKKNLQLDEEYIENIACEHSLNIVKTKEQNEEIMYILKKLSELERTVIVLKYFSDMSYNEMSNHIGYTPKHIGVILSRALKKFRKVYEKII